MLKKEFRILSRSRLYLVLFVLGITSGLIGLISYHSDISFYADNSSAISAYTAWLYCVSVGSSVYRILAPILIAPSLDTLFVEKKSGWLNFIFTRQSRKSHFFVSYFTGIVSAVTVLLSVLLTMLVVCITIFPANKPLVEYSVIADSYLNAVFTTKPLLYVCIILLSNSFFAAIYYSFAFGASRYVKNKYALMLIPFAIYIVLLISGQFFGIVELTPIVYIAPHELSGLSFCRYIVISTVLIIVATISVINGYRSTTKEIV